MERGDISNKPAPAIVIDIDNIIVEAPKITISEKFGKRFDMSKMEVDFYKVNDKIYPLLERLFYRDISIYLFAHRPSWYKEALEEKLEDLLFTRLYVGGIAKREALLRRQNVHWYYYNLPEHGSILSKEKERRVEKWNQISL